MGRRSVTAPRGPASRVERLIIEARDPPVLLLRGPSNSLKCWRNRCKTRCRGLYRSMTTIFTWVSNETTDRVGDSRMLVAFNNNTQRNHFLNSVKFPKHVTYVLGSLDGL